MTILDRTFPPDQCDPVAGDRWAAGHGASTMHGMHTHRVDSDYQRRAREAFVMDLEGRSWVSWDDDLRERLAQAIYEVNQGPWRPVWSTAYHEECLRYADAVLVHFPSPTDLSTLVELAALTTDRSPDEQAALERVAAWVDARSGLMIHTETVG